MVKAQLIVTSCSRRGLELEQVKHFLLGNGYALSRDEWQVDPTADVILLSTCGFTAAAEEFGFATLRRVQADKKPTAQVIFGGCIPKINPTRVAQTFAGPTFSPQSYAQLEEILGTAHRFDEFARPNTFGRHRRAALIADSRKALDLLKTFDGSFAGLEAIARRLRQGVRRSIIRTQYANLNHRDTFYVQIQEGCSMHCSYCAIRTAIGPLRSRPPAAILAEVQTGLAAGYRHFQLVGDNAGSYGLDLGTNLGHFLEQLVAIDQEFTLDLTDISPVYLPLIVASVKALCRQRKLSRLYVPIQSASRRILKLMGRDCDMATVQQLLIEIKALAPTCKLGTSLVVGFPSETDAELAQTIEFCAAVGFDWVWCHSFSARPETAAATLPDQIPAPVILQRAAQVEAALGRHTLVTTAGDAQGSKTCQG